MNEQDFEPVGSNYGKLVGKVTKGPIKTHTTCDEDFYEIMLAVKRLSEAVDIIPVTVGQRTIKDFSLLEEGSNICVTGEYRSINKLVGDKSRLMLYFFAKDIESQGQLQPTTDVNFLRLIGFICKMPIVRETPFHRQICDVLIAVNRNSNSRSDYIPCITWGRNAKYMGGLEVGTKVELVGRIQSRAYKKTFEGGEQEERIAYEVSCKNFAVVQDKEPALSL